MATLGDIGVGAAINILTALAFLLAYAVLRVQPINDRVYFPKWYLKRARHDPKNAENILGRIVNLDYRTYLKFLNWVPEALKMPEDELIDHAGLDSVVYLRIYLVGLKIFVPIAILVFAVLVPVNATSGGLEAQHKDFSFSDIDKLSISNVMKGSPRFWTHLVMAYMVAIWTLYVLYIEYETVTTMRLNFHASEHRRPDQYTVLVRNIPADPDESVSEHIEHFFRVNHPNDYLTHQIVCNANKLAKLVQKKESLQNWLVYNDNKFKKQPEKRPTRKKGFLGLWGERVDSIDFYAAKIKSLTEEAAKESEKVLNDPKSILPVAFVSFKSRWGAAVCAQTQQSKNPSMWLTEWAPEPKDVYWQNLAIPFVELAVRKLVISVAVFFLIFFFMIPVTLVQSLANISSIQRVVPFLKPVIDVNFIKSFIQGFLPGLALKIFLILLPTILMTMSKVEGHVSLAALERQSAAKFYLFMLVNVFLGSLITGTAFQQLKQFLNQSPTEIPKTIGETIPLKATFFITYIMVDGWAGIAGEILRLKPLIIFHLKNMFLIKTEKDREKAMDPGNIGFNERLPAIELYMLLGLVYAVVTPIILPFIIIYFGLSYFVFRNQVINVYDQKYESAARFWPHVHSRIITALIISQIVLLGLFSTREVGQITPAMIALPVLTLWFHRFCKRRFEPAFHRYPIEEATIRDTLERVNEPDFELKEYLLNAYIHPVFKQSKLRENTAMEMYSWKDSDGLVPTKRQSRLNTPKTSTNLSHGSPKSHMAEP